MTDSLTSSLATAQNTNGLCFDVSKWDRMLYDRRRATAGALDAACQSVEAAVTESTKDAKYAESVDGFAADLFARLYEDPTALDTGAEWAKRAHDLASNLPEFDELRAAVAGDADFAALATSDILSAIAPRLAELAKEEEQSDGNGQGGEQGEGQGQGNGRGQGQPSTDDKARAAMRGALRAAARKVEERKSDLAGLAPGLEHVPATHEQADAARMTLAEQVASNPRLRDVLRRAGKLARIAADRKQERKSRDAREEVVDLERGNDLARVLPAQLARLRNPATRLLALRDLVERQAIQYRLEGKEPLGRGPIVVLLDESGSMSGDPHNWAKAVGIACIGIAVREKRDVVVAGFDTGIRYGVRVAKDGTVTRFQAGRRAWTTLGNGKVADAALLVAGTNVGGGTDFTAPIQFAMTNGVTDDRADFVIVTDGECEFPTTIADDLRAAKEKGLRIFALTVNGGSTSRTVRDLADHVVDIDQAGDKDRAVAGALP
jgi:uncharacterized protein with von Willebrand factor type A (vWA) domain